MTARTAAQQQAAAEPQAATAPDAAAAEPREAPNSASTEPQTAMAPDRAAGEVRGAATAPEAAAAEPREAATAPGAPSGPRRRALGGDQRGVFAPFITVIVAAMLILGGIAYDAPRLTAARQDAVHAANEAARAAAATLAAGGAIEEARGAAEDRMAKSPLIYGQEILVAFLDCVGSRVQVTVVTGYVFRSAIALARQRQPIVATGTAEARLVLPSEEPSDLHFLGECPLT